MYLQYSPPYLSPFAKWLEGIVHHQHIHLCWCSVLTALYSTEKLISCFVLGPSQWFFHFGKEIVITWTQEKTTTLGGTEPHHSSWQCKESHRCCHGPLVPLAVGDSVTSIPQCSPNDFFTKLEEPLWGIRCNTRDEIICAIGWSIRNVNKSGCFLICFYISRNNLNLILFKKLYDGVPLLVLFTTTTSFS